MNESPNCPECGSESVDIMRKTPTIISYCCNECEHEWKKTREGARRT